MKWRTPSDRTQLILLSPIIVPLAAFSAAVILPCVGVVAVWKWIYVRTLAPKPDWHRWYAWRPVQHYNDADWMWLEPVERYWHGFGNGCVYRFAGEVDA